MSYIKKLQDVIDILIEDFGANKCETIDYDDFESEDKRLNAPSRCISCQATEVVEFLKEILEIYKEDDTN